MNESDSKITHLMWIQYMLGTLDARMADGTRGLCNGHR